jgi:hypothetical protein
MGAVVASSCLLSCIVRQIRIMTKTGTGLNLLRRAGFHLCLTRQPTGHLPSVSQQSVFDVTANVFKTSAGCQAVKSPCQTLRLSIGRLQIQIFFTTVLD